MSEPRVGGPATTYTIGDVVQLRSGGPKMTIACIIGDQPESMKIECQWFVDNEIRHAVFHVYSITPA